jgi:hypothetical protein
MIFITERTADHRRALGLLQVISQHQIQFQRRAALQRFVKGQL